MANKVLALLVVVAVAGVALGSLWLVAPGDVDASGHSAMRSFSSSSVAPGDTVTVTIVARDYGNLGRIVETVPGGFTTSEGGQTETIRLLAAGPQTVTYDVTATDSAGSHSFSGTLTDQDKDERSIGGETTVTITAPPSTPDTEPSATRSFSPTSVDPGGTVTVTIRANNYGGLGRVVETLPTGFTSPDASGQTVTLRLLQAGPQTSIYTVTASDNPGTYTFSGVLESEDKSETPVVGSSTVTVNPPPGPSARRSFSRASVDPGGTVTVTIRANNYGGLGRVVETLPTGFTSPDASGQTVTLRLLQAGPQTSIYTVTASDNPGTYTFSGVLESEDKSETRVLGSSRVTVATEATPPPTQNRAPAFSGSSTTRSIDENSAAGANVGSRVSATDRDRDRLTYALSGTDASSFTINSSSGQIMVGTGTMLDFEDKASYTVTVTATDPDGADDTITVTVMVGNVNEDGMVTLSEMRPRVGSAVTAMLSDDDEPVAGTVMWQWANSDPMAGTFADIDEATSASYTPVEGDVDMYLVAMAMYDDGHGTDKEAMMVTANPVIAASADACLEPLGMLPRTVSGTWASGCDSEGQANNYARYYTFTLSEETRVAIYLTSGRDTYLYLREGEGRTGTVEHQNNNVGRGSINSRIEETLPMGTYTVEATTYYRSAVTGDFTLDVRPVVRVQELGPLTETYTTPGTWSDDFVSARQAPNYARYYEFTLETPTDLRIDLTSERDTYLYLVGEDGTLVEENNNVGRSINSRIVQAGLAAGTYTVEATTYYRNPVTGNFVLNIGLIR